ncbi:MAG TPA: 2-oxoacid:ferredoxin oxidoreductase subunit gamma [Cyanobacteria bacterium UBA11991]|nr:2-oxoacid:acceptor oxidoreductase family protein [Cyanobacteriota bacterium]MDY6357966.1 2-oxoacid:acceptor oxidoreductase family protein [Cyanobacteriota bacterium]MDY6364245.1 2-oxoacid:acceptor oxidoreductase family protein [Cyanobacteriota bacterium]HCB11845.1 2-oxoacid:ferredoxin oxidoreductase subunit gamma [Cyanobacteria bacterium UBA11991]
MEKDFIIAGFGGQGVLLAGEVLANAFMLDDKNVTWYPSYGAEMRGGTVNCTVVMSDEEVSAVQKTSADFIIVLNQASFDKYTSWVKKGGSIIVNSSLAAIKKTRDDINYIFVPITKMAQETLGNIKMSNILSLGILSKISKLVSIETLEKALHNVIPPHRAHLIPKNIQALKLGYEYDLLKI